MKKFIYNLPMTPNQLHKRLNKDTIAYKGSINILSVSKFMKTHKSYSCFYGDIQSDKLWIAYHKQLKNDGSSVRFYAKYYKNDNGGTTVEGSFRKPIFNIVFETIWIVLMALASIFCLALKENTFALISFAGLLFGAFMFYFPDKRKRQIKEYFENLQKDKKNNTHMEEN